MDSPLVTWEILGGKSQLVGPTYGEVIPGIVASPRTIKFRLEADEAWTGTFLPGSDIGASATGVWRTSDNCVVVVVAGAGYLVDVAQRTGRRIGGLEPILHVLEQEDFVVIADYLRIAAVKGENIVWQSERLSFDGFREITVADASVHALAWHAPEHRYYPVEIDLVSGDVRTSLPGEIF